MRTQGRSIDAEDEHLLLPQDIYEDIALPERKLLDTRADIGSRLLYDCNNPESVTSEWYDERAHTTIKEPERPRAWASIRNFICALSLSIVFIISCVTFYDFVARKSSSENAFRISGPETIRKNLTHQWTLMASFSGALNRSVITTNGIMPGPLLEGVVNSNIVIEIHSMLDFPIAIHWHGISQFASNDQDGVPAITQDSILPGRTFEYHFQLDQIGTFWWHAHADAMRSDGLYGALIVHPRDKINSSEHIASSDIIDHVLMASDWYETGAVANAADYLAPSNIELYEPIPDSIMVNGVLSSGSQRTRFMLPRDGRTKRYWKLRIINVGAFAEILVKVPTKAGWFIVIEADSTSIMAVKASSLTIAVGQRYSVILDTDDYTTNEDIYIDFELDMKSHTGNAAVPLTGNFNAAPQHHHHSHHTRTIPSSRSINSSDSTDMVQLHDGMLHPAEYTPWSSNVTNTAHIANQLPFFKLEFGMETRNGITKSVINHTSYVPQNHPISHEYHASTNDTTGLSHKYSPDILTLSIKQGEDVLLLLRGTGGGNHPIHIHGHQMNLLASDSFFFDPVTQERTKRPFDQSILSSVVRSAMYGTLLERSIARDTINVEDGGWVLVKVRGAGKGVWLMHCHSTWHEMSGMAMVVDVR